MNIRILDSGDPLKICDIEQAEKLVERAIPLVYREFLLRNNGGSPRPDTFMLIRPNKRSLEVSVDWFLGINTSYGINIEWHVREYGKRMPPELFPVAADPGGNLICISTSSENEGKIYYWDHNYEPEPNIQPYYGNVYFVANSFDEFLDSLK